MSYSLLIVDDEAIERGGIRHLVENEIPDITEIMEAANGVEMIRTVEEKQPDILILDVDMPGLNGLEALTLIQQKGFDGKVVVHTAHNEFQYARDALNLAADAFILKPSKRKELITLLRRLIGEIEEVLRHRNEESRLKTILKEMMPIVRSDLMASIVSGDVDPRQAAAHRSGIGREFHSAQVMTVRLPDVFFLDATSAESSLKARILERLTEFLGDGKQGFAGMIVSQKVPLILFPDSDLDEFHNRIWAIEQAERIRDFLKKEFRIEVTIGIGSVRSSLPALTQSYRESIAALSLTGSELRIHHHSDSQASADLFNAEAIAAEIASAGPGAPLPRTAAILLNPDESLDRSKDRILSVLFECRRRLIVDDLASDETRVGNRALFSRLEAVRTGDELPAVLRDLVDEIFEAVQSRHRQEVHIGVRDARRFIEENFMKSISLELVAEEVGISPYYLSHLFKDEMGVTYIQFLTDYRMRKAGEYIESGRYSMAEIAEKCGYSNPAYFAKVFRKNTGSDVVEDRGVARRRTDDR